MGFRVKGLGLGCSPLYYQLQDYCRGYYESLLVTVSNYQGEHGAQGFRTSLNPGTP